MMKTILGRYGNTHRHWVGDGFPVRTLFSYGSLGDQISSYGSLGDQISPFLLLDYAGPHVFAPAAKQRGVGPHPHRGFETVTIVYDGEVEHRDSAGNGGIIGPGDVQWMTAGGGILHEEFHSNGYTRAGGPFRMVQLWVNLPARNKMVPGGYQAIANAGIPMANLPEAAGTLRVIAGAFGGVQGPARTFTPVHVWDAHLAAGADVRFDLAAGHNAMLVVLSGHVTANRTEGAGEAEVLLLDRDGTGVEVRADGETKLLVLSGEPIDEPIVGYGPFVMNSEAEIREAIDDFNSGRFGKLAA